MNRIAHALLRTNSLDQAEAAVLAAGRTSELDYERAKAARITARGVVSSVVEILDPNLAGIEAATAGRGVDFVTLRRLAEMLNLSASALPSMCAYLQTRDHRR